MIRWPLMTRRRHDREMAAAVAAAREGYARVERTGDVDGTIEIRLPVGAGTVVGVREVDGPPPVPKPPSIDDHAITMPKIQAAADAVLGRGGISREQVEEAARILASGGHFIVPARQFGRIVGTLSVGPDGPRLRFTDGSSPRMRP